MVCQAKIELGVHRFMKLLPKLGCELRASIRHNFLWYSMQTYDTGHVYLGELSSRIGRLDGDEMGNLSQSIHDDPYGIIPYLSTG
jgi:hypothetical protein